LGAIVIFLVGKLIVNWVNKLFAKLLVKQKVEPGVQTFLKSLVNILLLIMLGLAVIGKLGIELTGFAALLASAGVAVGMALSGQLQNFAGGIIILVFRPYKVGDYIESDNGASGTVQEIQIFHTVLVTPDNKVVYAPNGSMSNAICTNYSHKDERRLDFVVNIEYGEDYNKVEGVIREILAADERILKTPAPFIELGKLSESSVDITVRVWVKASDYWAVHFQTNQNIYKTFNERGISFPYSQIVVHQG
jgi:small conductance mechanosensitive channel